MKNFAKIYFVAVILATALFFIFKVSPLVTLTIIGLWPLVGSLITIDDDLPGGWSNPDGDKPFPTEIYKAAAVFLIVTVCTGAAITFVLDLL